MAAAEEQPCVCNGGAEPEISDLRGLASSSPPAPEPICTFWHTCARALAVLELFVRCAVADGGWESSTLLITFQRFPRRMRNVPLFVDVYSSSSDGIFLLFANLTQRSAACKLTNLPGSFKSHQQIGKSCQNRKYIHIFFFNNPAHWLVVNL